MNALSMSVSTSYELNFLIITANVGTLFENLDEIEKPWIEEIVKVIEKSRSHFIALHCQEVGGKDYKSVFDPVTKFFEKLSTLNELEEYTVVQGFLDGKYNSPDHFTALGNVYMVHKSVIKAELYNFENKKFLKICGKTIISDKEKEFSNAQKERFDQDFFAECKWSRKGYIRVRWRINDRVVEFVNVHLFHDDSNLAAVQNTPSRYTANRKRALTYVMNKLKTECPLADDALQFVFGDFNFRLDVKSLIKHICPSSREQAIRSSNEKSGDDVIRKLYRLEASNGKSTSQSDENEIVVTLEKKYFLIQHESFQPNTQPEKLRSFDIEFPSEDIELKEYDVTFPPTYPYSENVTEPTQYMKTRCPSWCDRILLSTATWDWMHSDSNQGDVVYDVVGKNVCMGDHKPVYLSFTVPTLLRKDETTNENGEKVS